MVGSQFSFDKFVVGYAKGLYEHRYRALYVCDYLDAIELYRHRAVIAITKYQSLGRGLMKAFDKILLPILGRVKNGD